MGVFVGGSYYELSVGDSVWWFYLFYLFYSSSYVLSIEDSF